MLPDGLDDPRAVIVLAIVVAVTLGPLAGRGWLVTAAIARGPARWLADKLNRAKRGSETLMIRGLVVTAIVMILAAVGAGVLIALVPSGLARAATDTFLLATSIQIGHGWQVAGRVAGALRRSQIDIARKRAAPLSYQPIARADEHGLARIAIEHQAVGLDRGLIAPVFWYAVFGLAGLLVYVAVLTLERVAGQQAGPNRDFGWGPTRIEEVLNAIPGRLAGLVIVLAALCTPSAAPSRSTRAIVKFSHRHPSSTLGWPVSAMAGALTLSLVGPDRTRRGGPDTPWIGDGRARASARDIVRARLVSMVSTMIVVAVAAASLAFWV